MTKTRLEAFSDGVLAIIITIMVLEIKVPHGTEPSQLKPLVPVFLSYALSFVFVGIYWNNHHHLLQASRRVNGKVLWANLHLLFWLSLIPFVTGWMGENEFAQWPVMLYGVVLLLAAIAYTILERLLIGAHVRDEDNPLADAIGKDVKGMISLALYAAAIGLSFWTPIVSCILYVTVALLWLYPDSRIERKLTA